jgi:hypothetical protein
MIQLPLQTTTTTSTSMTNPLPTPEIIPINSHITTAADDPIDDIISEVGSDNSDLDHSQYSNILRTSDPSQNYMDRPEDSQDTSPKLHNIAWLIKHINGRLMNRIDPITTKMSLMHADLQLNNTKV